MCVCARVRRAYRGCARVATSAIWQARMGEKAPTAIYTLHNFPDPLLLQRWYPFRRSTLVFSFICHCYVWTLQVKKPSLARWAYSGSPAVMDTLVSRYKLRIGASAHRKEDEQRMLPLTIAIANGTPRSAIHLVGAYKPTFEDVQVCRVPSGLCSHPWFVHSYMLFYHRCSHVSS